MQYEPPRIVRRERIEALLSFVISNVDGIGSDVNTKERIVAVRW